MATNPSPFPTRLTTPRPFSPTTRQRMGRTLGQTTGSATQTLTNTSPQRSEPPEALVLRLRGAHTPQSDSAEDSTAEGSQRRRRRPHIQWAEDVIDNEGLGRKSSKVCCIYHKPRAVGESSDESSSDSSSSDSDSGMEQDGARPVRGGSGSKGRGRRPTHKHDQDEDGCGDHSHGKGSVSKKARRPSPNAYEKMPKYDVKPLTQQPGSGR